VLVAHPLLMASFVRSVAAQYQERTCLSLQKLAGSLHSTSMHSENAHRRSCSSKRLSGSGVLNRNRAGLLRSFTKRKFNPDWLRLRFQRSPLHSEYLFHTRRTFVRGDAARIRGTGRRWHVWAEFKTRKARRLGVRRLLREYLAPRFKEPSVVIQSALE
jgi:hypothetical protein